MKSLIQQYGDAIKRNRILFGFVCQKIQADHIWIYDLIAKCRAKSAAHAPLYSERFPIGAP